MKLIRDATVAAIFWQLAMAALLVFLLGLAGCGDAEERVQCHAPVPRVGHTSLSADGTATYWTECWVCDDGSSLKRTWGPRPRDGQTGPAVTNGPSVDVAGGCK